MRWRASIFLRGNEMARRNIIVVLLVVVAVAAAGAFLFRMPGDRVLERRASITLRLSSFNLGLDPANILDTESRRIIDMLHARLLTADEADQLSPEIADTWKWDDPLTLRVILRPGLAFSNGAPVRAQDAAWSLCRNIQPTAPFRWLFGNIVSEADGTTGAIRCTGLVAVDEHTLLIHITHSPDRLLRALSSSMGAVIPEGAKPGEYSAVPGIGPYRIERIEANTRVELVANRGGPIEAGAKRIVFRYVPDDAAAASQFDAGELDVLEVGNPRLLAMVNRAMSNEGARVKWTDAHQIRFVIVNMDRLMEKFHWRENEVRGFANLLASAVDQRRLAATYGELGKPLSTAYFPARTKAAPRRAAVAPPGISKGELFLITENDAYSDLVGATIPSSLGDLIITRQGLDKGLLVDRLIKRDYDLACITLEALVDDPVYWMSFFRPGSPFSVFGRPLATLANKEPGDFDPVRLTEIIDTEGNWIPLFQERRAYFFRPGVEGERFLPTGLIDYRRLRRSE